MFLKKNNRGYGWYSKVTTKDENGSEFTSYLNFSFKKDTEPNPTQLNEYQSYQCELYLRDNAGIERRVFPIVKFYNNKANIEFKLLEPSNEFNDEQPTYTPQVETNWQQPLDGRPDEEYYRNQIYRNEISQDDLPFSNSADDEDAPWM